MKRILLFITLASFFLSGCGQDCQNCCECCKASTSGKADKIVYGNIITMDPHKMNAEAMTIKNGLVQYVGSASVAKALCDENTEVEDYGSASIYPGFIDVHVHPQIAGQRMINQINLVGGGSIDEYLETIREFIAANPDMKSYSGAGWSPRDREMLATDLDAICPDKPVLLNSIDGHSFWINSVAMKMLEIDKKAVEEDGVARIHADAEGNPTGVIAEENERIAQHIQPAVEDAMKQLQVWQNFAFGLGLTTVGDAGFGSPVYLDAYQRLENEGKLKLLTCSSYLISVIGQPVEEKVAQTVEARQKYTSAHFRIPGIKLFIDGVVEGHTAWVIDEYCDQPGYFGVKKESDHEYLTALVKRANENGLYLHFHTIGDGAAKFAVDAIEDAQKQTGLYDARNCMAHLQLVRPEDVKRIADNNITAIVAPLWTPYSPGVSDLEEKYIGAERCAGAYPIRSFLEAGAVVAFHTDYPVSTEASIPQSVVLALTRGEEGAPARNPEKEGISRLQALKAMTTDAAYALREEGEVGMLHTGFRANYAVFDSDFLCDPLEKVGASSLVATAVEGEVVWPAE